jgi:GAF domain-containing protein
MTDYQKMLTELRALTDEVPHRIANLANASALIYDALGEVNWVGFYLLEGNTLVLGPFQGKPACIEIPIGRGVCGTAAARKETLLVPNVHEFPGHIACDSASNSEIVIPLFSASGDVLGVLDIDSTRLERFTEADRVGLEAIAEHISLLLSR